MKETRRKGLYQGGAVLYGYKIDGRNIVIDENEAEVVRYMYSQYAKGEFVREIIPTDIYEKVRAKVAANRYGKKSVQVDFF